MASDNGKGTMFGDLQKHYEKDFFKENKEIIIYTYEIFAALTSNNKLLPALYDFDDKDDYQEFIDSVYNSS